MQISALKAKEEEEERLRLISGQVPSVRGLREPSVGELRWSHGGQGPVGGPAKPQGGCGDRGDCEAEKRGGGSRTNWKRFSQ